jgi:AcrR family transcriptional regulator
MARPSTPLLNQQAIVDAAVDIVDADGVAGLSMRRLAARLGVSGPSLYHHFASKDEILDAIVEQINSRIRMEEVGPGWETALTSYAYQLRALLVAHPHVVEFLALRPVTKHAGLRIYEHMISVMAGCGWNVSAGRDMTLAVENLVYGAALMANAPDIDLTAEQRSDYPMLARLPDEPSHKPPDDGFDLGFAALMNGFRRLAEESDAQISATPRARTC